MAIVADRLAERIDAYGISKTALARAVGVKQPTITRLVNGTQRSSSQLHKIARELGTTSAYLTGETNDPSANVPDAPTLDSETRELVDCFGTLTPVNRRALLQVARSMADGHQAHETVQSPRIEYTGE